MSPRFKGKKKIPSVSKTAPSLPVLHPHAAGIDIGAREIYVAVPPDHDPKPVRAFATFTADLHALRDWLKTCGVTSVAMESTGVYWIPLFQILEAAGIEVCFARIEDMPYREGVFDLAVCTDVLEHVFDLHLSCTRLLAAVKPGGLVFVRVPYREDLSGYLATTCPYRYVHLRTFDEHGLRLLFERVFGCAVLETHLAGYMPYQNRLRVPAPFLGGQAVLPRVLSILRTLREEWHARLVRALYLPIEINAVIQTPGRPRLRPAEAGAEPGESRSGA